MMGSQYWCAGMVDGAVYQTADLKGRGGSSPLTTRLLLGLCDGGTRLEATDEDENIHEYEID